MSDKTTKQLLHEILNDQKSIRASLKLMNGQIWKWELEESDRKERRETLKQIFKDFSWYLVFFLAGWQLIDFVFWVFG